MKKFNSTILIILVCITLSCDDVFEEDITNDVLTMLSPKNGEEIEGNSIQFQWIGIEGAEAYRIQINNKKNQAIVLDTVVETTVYNYAINPGSYQWRVRGENFAYHTAYTFNSEFTVNSSLDLSEQVVSLKTPLNNIYTNEVELAFSWQGITTADFYKFQLLKISNGTEELIFENKSVLDTSIVLTSTTITEDAEYIWRVSAENESSFTEYFARTLFVDTQEPPAPNLITPTLNQNFNIGQDVNFSWNFDNDTGVVKSGISGTIEISSNETFSNIILTDTNANGTFSSQFDSAATYYWRVKGLDDAGNTGAYNSTGKFVIK